MLINSALYSEHIGPYIVRNAFIHNFGHTLAWWTSVLLQLVALVVMDLVVQAIRRVYFAGDQDLMQRIEKDGNVDKIFNPASLEDGDEEQKAQQEDTAPRAREDDHRPRFTPPAEERESPADQWRR
jgi:phospholipid-translocating ATPase